MSQNETKLLRLNKHLALSLGASRREADNLIAKGVVKINNQPASLGSRYQENDIISVNNKVIATKTNFIYVAVNKPVGYICSRRQQGDTPTIYELLPKEYQSLKTVGRLDCDSSGLILLTNDGDFTYQMTHPRFYKIKKYNVRLDKDLEPLHQQMISDYGIRLDDGPSKLQLEKMDDNNRKGWIVIMHEGRNRQIRRTFSSLGYTVKKLHRTDFGSFSLGNIESGKFKVVNIS